MRDAAYTTEELTGMYELGRSYLQMGFFTPAERILSAVSAIGGAKTPAQVGLGLIFLERGSYEEAARCFRAAVESGAFPGHARVGLSVAFLAGGDPNRARSMLQQLKREFDLASDRDLLALCEALELRTAAE